MVREILVGIDFSEVSDRALDTAGEHARAWGARLHLLHVVPPTTDPAPSAGLERRPARRATAVGWSSPRWRRDGRRRRSSTTPNGTAST
jgi:nucleotide-binding universal stress UspA family protein